HRLALHLRDDPETAAHAEEAQPEKGPGQQRHVRHHARSASGRSRDGVGSARRSQKLAAVITSTTPIVGSRSGPTPANVSAATNAARPPRSEPRMMRSVVTSTRPTTAALIPRIDPVAVAPNTPRT